MASGSRFIRIYSLLILCGILQFPGSLSGQDWQLFPTGQKSWFLDDQYAFQKTANLYVFDSVMVNGTTTTSYSRRNLNLQGIGNCYEDTVQGMYNNSSLYYIDSVTSRSDTTFFYHPFYGPEPFYFVNNAQPGESWTITSMYPGNDYNQITINCSGIQVENFLGISDSVKSFTMSANGTSANQVPASNFVMKLSKHYGLTEFVPFQLFLYHPANLNFMTMKLIGIDSAGTTYGFKQPRMSDYFHLSPGDLLMWEHNFSYFSPLGGAPWSEYYLDSIIQVLYTPDSIVYTYDRTLKDTDQVITHQYGITESFSFRAFGNIIETPPEWFGFGNNHYTGYYSPMQNFVLMWRSGYLTLEINASSGDTASTFRFDTWAQNIDTTNCTFKDPLDLGMWFEVNTDLGVTEHCFYNFNTDCHYLLGARINGVQTGNISLSLQEHSGTKYLYASVSPNPASEFVEFSLPRSVSVTGFEIMSCHGQICISGSAGSNRVDISFLDPGMYFVRVKTNRGVAVARFIRE